MTTLEPMETLPFDVTRGFPQTIRCKVHGIPFLFTLKFNGNDGSMIITIANGVNGATFYRSKITAGFPQLVRDPDYGTLKFWLLGVSINPAKSVIGIWHMGNMVDWRYTGGT